MVKKKTKLLILLVASICLGLYLMLKKKKKGGDMPSYLRGVVPIDLERKDVEWIVIKKEDRKKIFKDILENKFKIKDDKLCASLYASTLYEQPSKFPNYNILGWGIWAKQFPWGWKQLKDFWTKNPQYKPSGYIIVREGAGGKMAVMFAFRDLEHFLRNAIEIWRIRKILTPKDYAIKWVGTKSINENVWLKNYQYYLV